MKLLYRGVAYDYQPKTREIVRDITHPGYYRGLSFIFHAPQWAPQPQRAVAMQYRGIRYEGLAPIQPATTVVPALAPRIQPAFLLHMQPDQVDTVHRHHILDRLQHRLLSAQAKGDLKLVQMLETEQQQTA